MYIEEEFNEGAENMNKLITPFGIVNITINGNTADYIVEELDKICPFDDGSGYLYNVDGRYKIIPYINLRVKSSFLSITAENAEFRAFSVYENRLIE